MNAEQPIQYISPNPGISPVQEDLPTLKPKVGRSRAYTWIGVMILIIMVVAIGIILTRQEASNQDSAAGIPAGRVTIESDGTFSPQVIKVKSGQGVVWTNQSASTPQIAISDSADLKPDLLSGTQLYSGDSFSYVFTQPGTYHFYDATSPLASTNTVIVE